MKLNELAVPKTGEERATGKLSDKEMDIAYEKLLRNEMTKEEIVDFASVIASGGDYARTADSATFLLNRMHILLHGIAPEGETPERAATMFRIPERMKEYVIRKGHLDWEDLNLHIGEARKELASRPPRKKKVSPEQARKMMVAYYKTNVDKLPRDIQKHRPEILRSIGRGDSPEEAFTPYIQH